MAWRLANSLITLRNQVNAAAPNRNKASDGTIGDPSHQAEASGSDHNPNRAGVVCAFDITSDPGRGMDVGRLAESLVASRDNRIKYLIFNRRAVEPGRFGWGWQPYSGSNPHTSHLHVSVAGNYDDNRAWNTGATNQGDDMSKATTTEARILAFHILGDGRALSGSIDNDLKPWIGRETNGLIDELYNSNQAKNYRANIYGKASKTLADETTVRLAYNLGLLRDANNTEIAARAGKQTEEQLLRDVLASKEHKDVQSRGSNAEYSPIAEQLYRKK